MDFFEELSKQTSKMLNNFALTMNEIATMATSSTDSAAEIILLKGKAESLKLELNTLYTKIGRLTVNDPDQDHSQIIQEAKKIVAELKEIENRIEELKEDISQNSQHSKQVAVNSAEKALKDSTQTLSQQAEKLKNYIESQKQDVEITIEEIADSSDSE